MMTDFNLEEHTKDESNYPRIEDNSFTPDEQDNLEEYKAILKAKIRASRGVLRGLKISTASLTSYSLAKFLILSLGSQGLAPAFATVLTITFLSNTDTFDSLNVDKKSEGWQTEGMGKLLKFGFSVIVSASVLVASIGNFYQLSRTSEQTYHDLQSTLTKFNRLPKDDQNLLYFEGSLVFIAVLSVAVMVNGNKR